MLTPISKQKAFNLLLDPKTAYKVYFKYRGDYVKAIDYKFVFGWSDGIDFRKIDFYEED